MYIDCQSRSVSHGYRPESGEHIKGVRRALTVPVPSDDDTVDPAYALPKVALLGREEKGCDRSGQNNGRDRCDGR